MQHILVTGGTGYIGSHTVVDLVSQGYHPIIVDNQSNSSLSVLEGIKEIVSVDVTNYSIDICDKKALTQVFEENNIVGVIHFAAYKSVNESVNEPLKYFSNNIGGLNTLLEVMDEQKVNRLIFSSSCSVYGNAEVLPVTEETPLAEAESPYGRTKQIGEKMIQDYCQTNADFKAINLRYFNPAGAHDSNAIGELSLNPPTNLVPVITETGIGKRSDMTVFGDDYPTRDGSCIRDYIHVMDLAAAHTQALKALEQMEDTNLAVYNLGIGEGVTVLEAIKAFEQVSGQSLNYNIGPRRAGDVMSIYADTTQVIKKLGWSPTRDINDIMRTAWNWEVKRSR